MHCPQDNDCKESAGTAYCQPESRQPTEPTQPTQPTQPTAGGPTGLEMLLGAGIAVLGGALVYFLFLRK